jgi:signal transduction histidine kinase
MARVPRISDVRSEAVYKATLAIATELSIDAALQKIVDAAKELVNAEYGALGVVDEDRRRLIQFVVSGISSEEIRTIGSWPRGLGLLGELIHFPRPLRIKDMSKDPRSVGFPANHPPMSSFLGVPVIRGGKVLGNFYMTNKQGAEEFSEEDEEILSLFAAHAAIAVENARLYTETDIQLKAKVLEVERAERRSTFLAELGAMLLQLPPGEDPPLKSIVERAAEVLGDVTAVYLLDPGGDQKPASGALFHALASRRRAAQDVVREWWQPLLDWVVAGGQPLLISGMGEESESPMDLEVLRQRGFSAALAVPIVSRETTGGILLSLASRPLTFSEEDLRFATLIADRIASALNTARLHRLEIETRARVQELAALAERRATELETVLDTMAEAVLVVDTQMRLVRFNKTYARLVDLEEGESVSSLDEYVQRLNPQAEGGGAVAREDLPWARALRGETFTNQVLLVSPPASSEDRFLSISGAPIRDASGRIVAAVNAARDVTDIKEVDQLKDEFISVASHELKTPLTVVRGYAQILIQRLDKKEDGGAEHRMAGQILEQADRMSSLADRLLDVSRIQFGRLHLERWDVDLAPLVQRVAEGMQVSFPHHRIHVSASEPLRARVDPSRVEQVLSNLLSNAAKYSPDGAEVELTLERRGRDALISVRDQGRGIPKDQQPYIFRRFFRARSGEGRSGTGLGLYVSKGIVEAHGGRIWFESQEGKGSTFYVLLPVG